MMKQDFENFELRLKTLREESREDFECAEKVFDANYKGSLENIFPRDILGIKKSIAGRFIVGYAENLDQKDAFQLAVSQSIKTLPLSLERQESLKDHILQQSNLSESLQSFFQKNDTISRDPFFALVEDFSIDGEISKEEFLLLQQSYEQEGDFLKALESLPKHIRDMFHGHIEHTLSHEYSEKKREFESEYSQELSILQKRGVSIEPVVVFVSRSYYKTPGKYRKFEHPKRRMRRTFKIALLRLLRAKLGNIDAQKILEKFESGENFEDLFMLLFKLLEVINEDPSGQEVFSLLKLDEQTQDEVFTAEENKQKILAGESLVMKIASMFSKSDALGEEQELDDGMLEKILDESTDIVGEDIYFNREEEKAGIYAEQSSVLAPLLPGEEDDEEEIDYDKMSPETAYEILKRDFHKIEEDKRKAFGSGEYDDVDVYNEKLVGIQLKLEKLTKLLGIDE